MKFSIQAWKDISDIYHAILSMDFLRELEAGTLGKEVFQNYIVQDAIYLGEFSRVLAIISAKAPQPEIQLQFANSAREAIAVERSLHEDFFAEFGIIAEAALATEPSPTCLGYTNFLTAVAYQHSFSVIVAAILPCFWIYSEVGKYIYQRAAQNNPYQKWLDTYVDADFEASVKYTIEVCDRAAEQASVRDLALMKRVFYRASQYEWLFWNSAYRLERWEVGKK